MKKRLFVPRLETLETREVPTVYIWDGAVSASWQNAYNWCLTSGQTDGNYPGPADTAVFSTGNAYGTNADCTLSGDVACAGITMSLYSGTVNLQDHNLTTGGTSGTGGSDSIWSGLFQLHGGAFTEGGSNNNWRGGGVANDNATLGAFEVAKSTAITPGNTQTVQWKAKTTVDAAATLTFSGASGGDVDLGDRGYVTTDSGVVNLDGAGANPFDVTASAFDTYPWHFQGTAALDAQGDVRLTQDFDLYDHATATDEAFADWSAGNVYLHNYAQLTLDFGSPALPTIVSANVTLFDYSTLGAVGWTQGAYRAVVGGTLTQDGEATLVTIAPNAMNVYSSTPTLTVTGNYVLTAGTLDQTIYFPAGIPPAPVFTSLSVAGEMAIGTGTVYSVNCRGTLGAGDYDMASIQGGYAGTFGAFNDHGGPLTVWYANSNFFGVEA